MGANGHQESLIPPVAVRGNKGGIQRTRFSRPCQKSRKQHREQNSKHDALKGIQRVHLGRASSVGHECKLTADPLSFANIILNQRPAPGGAFGWRIQAAHGNGRMPVIAGTKSFSFRRPGLRRPWDAWEPSLPQVWFRASTRTPGFHFAIGLSIHWNQSPKTIAPRQRYDHDSPDRDPLPVARSAS